MAHDKEIRFRCRALFEVLGTSLSDISKDELVGISTLSDWKNDDRVEYGGIWVKGCKTKNIQQTAERLKEELQATSVYDEMKKNVVQYYGVDDNGELETKGMLDVVNGNAEIQATAEADVTLLASIGADYFDAQLLKNSILSSITLNNQLKSDPTKVKQADIKASSEIHKIAKESRFGKSPDTVVFNVNGDYSPEELNDLTIDELEQLVKKEESRIVQTKQIEHPSIKKSKSQ